MDYEKIFSEAIEAIQEEGRYRVFADIMRERGNFPRATRYNAGDNTKNITVWCSNDYLGMGQNPVVQEALSYFG